MNTLYLDCTRGAAGDMIMAALLDLVDRKEEFLALMNRLFPGVDTSFHLVAQNGISGLGMCIRVDGVEEESMDRHSSRRPVWGDAARRKPGERALSNRERIAALPVSDSVKKNAAGVLRVLTQAQAAVHGQPVEQVHFHPLGNADALADIVGVCVLMDWLRPHRVISSPITVGYGQVWCPRGILPVPAPATAHILQQAPTRRGNIEGERCTPTGAALITYFTTEFHRRFRAVPGKTGIGFGKKRFSQPSCLRAHYVAEDTASRAGERKVPASPEGLAGFAASMS